MSWQKLKVLTSLGKMRQRLSDVSRESWNHPQNRAGPLFVGGLKCTKTSSSETPVLGKVFFHSTAGAARLKPKSRAQKRAGHQNGGVLTYCMGLTTWSLLLTL